MKREFIKRHIIFFICAALLVCMEPVTALAAESGGIIEEKSEAVSENESASDNVVLTDDTEIEAVFDANENLEETYSEEELEPAGAGNVSKINKPRTSGGGSTWDCIWFGEYWQSSAYSTKEPIKWRVLDIDESGNALLLADKLIDIECYSTSAVEGPWETCTLRSFLNSYDSSANTYGTDYSFTGFLNNAFSSDEISAITQSTVVNGDNPVYGTAGGNNTSDKIFCLSIAEAMTADYGFLKNEFTRPSSGTKYYTDDDPTRVAVKTGYTYGKNGFHGHTAGTEGFWWLRSPGYHSGLAAYVDYAGYVIAYGINVGYIGIPIRPAFRMNLSSSSSLWSYAGTVRSDGKETNDTSVTYDSNEEISINYSGSALAHIHLVDSTGKQIAKPGDELVYSTSSGNKNVKVDDDGCVYVQSDVYTYSTSKSNEHTFSTILKDSSGKEIAIININNILVNDISYSQKWNAKIDVSGTLKLGEAVGGSIGPAEAEASLGGVSATGSIASTMELENSYKEGQRNLNISQKYDRKIGVKGNIGPKAKFELLNTAFEIKELEVSGSAGVGQQVSSGIKIKNYDPSDPSNAFDIGKYLLCGTAESSGNVYLMHILELLGYEGSSDVIGSKVSLEGKGGIDFLTVSAGKGEVKAEASVMSAEKGGVLSFEANRDRSDSSGSLFTKKKSYKRNASMNLFDTSIPVFKKSPVSIKTGFHGLYFDDEHVTDVSVSGKINSLYDTNKSKDNITKITYGGTLYQDGDLYNKHSELSHKIVYADGDAQIVASSVPAVGNFYENFIGGLSKDDINDIEQCKTARATFSDTYKEKTTVDVPLKLGLQAGAGLEVEAKLKGIYEESYEIESGIYDYNEEKGERDEIKTNVCDSDIVEGKIDESKTDILTVLAEPIASIANFVKDKVIDVMGQVGETVKNGFAIVYNTTSDLVVHITRLTDDASTASLDIDSVSTLSSSYEIYTYSDVESLDALGNNQETESIASTVGEPYLVSLTDENGNAVNDWKGESIKLVLEYTDEMLSAAGASGADASGLAIYKYSQDKLGYLYKGGTVDTTERTVTLDIMEEGQYILALDNVAPTVSVFTTMDDSNPPTIIAALDEMSGFSEFSLKIDDDEVVNLTNFDQYYDVDSKSIKYQVKYTLSPGIHKATLIATDLVGNSMATPAELEIKIPDPTKEIEVTFDANEGVVLPITALFTIGEKYGELPIPERKGYQFVGWFTKKNEGIQITSETIIENDINILYAHWSLKPSDEDSKITLEADQTNYTMLPGEVRRLSVSKTDQYIYGIKWTLDSASPKGCVTLKNGIITAKKAGTAKVTATYGSSSVTFNINVDGKTYSNTVIQEGKKKYKITATKSITANVGDTKKSVAISIPANLRVAGKTIDYEILTDGVCSVGTPVYNKTDRTKASKATFKITPLDAGATWIIWSMTNDSGNKTQAATKVIVKKPMTNLQFSETSMDIAAGEGKLLVVTGTKDNTDTKDLTFSVKGKGVKVSKSGFILGTAPGNTATVIVKCGKATASIKVNVSGDKNKYLTLNKNTVNVTIPKSGAKAKTTTLKLATPKKKTDQPKVTWSVSGSPVGISMKDGKVSVESSAFPGCYVIIASPEDSSSGFNSACCELVLK